MKRRKFLSAAAATGAALWVPHAVGAAASFAQTGAAQLDAHATSSQASRKLLILIELKGGNDGLNTVIPFADPVYYSLRQHIAIPRDDVIPLDMRTALHPSLNALMPVWTDGQLAVVQGVGFAQSNRSHFRSTQIWDTASRVDAYLSDGWLTRAMSQWPRASLDRDVLTIGSVEAGPLARLQRDGEFEFADSLPHVADPDDAPLASAEEDAAVAGDSEALQVATTFDAAVVHVLDTLAARSRATAQPRVVRLTLSGFDTHCNQPARHAALLEQLADGCAALRSGLTRLGYWNDTLLMTYSEFGRSVKENASGGTEHGNASAHFAMGGRVHGGLYGAIPELTRLDEHGDLPVAVDVRRLIATALGPFMQLDAAAVLQEAIQPLPLWRA